MKKFTALFIAVLTLVMCCFTLPPALADTSPDAKNSPAGKYTKEYIARLQDYTYCGSDTDIMSDVLTPVSGEVYDRMLAALEKDESTFRRHQDHGGGNQDEEYSLYHGHSIEEISKTFYDFWNKKASFEKYMRAHRPITDFTTEVFIKDVTKGSDGLVYVNAKSNMKWVYKDIPEYIVECSSKYELTLFEDGDKIYICDIIEVADPFTAAYRFSDVDAGGLMALVSQYLPYIGDTSAVVPAEGTPDAPPDGETAPAATDGTKADETKTDEMKTVTVTVSVCAGLIILTLAVCVILCCRGKKNSKTV